jgi:hypothetical protein
MNKVAMTNFLLFLPFHCAYIALYIIAFIPSMGAFCSDGRLIPHCFLFANIVFFLGYFWTLYLKHRDFLFPKAVQEECN